MKKIISILSDHNFQKVMLGAVIAGFGTTIVIDVMYHIGVRDGGKAIMRFAEKMQPGFTDQLTSFYDASRKA